LTDDQLRTGTDMRDGNDPFADLIDRLLYGAHCRLEAGDTFPRIP
jgi:hypothetical protein